MAKVCVILPVYNGQEFILESVQSVLKQTYKDFVLYVIDDGSTDKSLQCLDQIKDQRLKVVENGTNKGLIHTLNRGLELAQSAEYIARMDADDITHPNRLGLQVQLLDEMKAVGVVGTRANIFGNGLNERKLKVPEREDRILPAFICRNPIIHPSVMMRGSVIFNAQLRYDSSFPKYEDYKLWIDMFNICGFYNMPQYLLNYRRHSGNVTAAANYKLAEDKALFLRLLTEYAGKFDAIFDETELECLAIISSTYRWQLNTRLTVDEIYRSIITVLYKHQDLRIDKKYLGSFLLERALVYLVKCKRYNDLIKLVGMVNVKMNYIHVARIRANMF